MKAVLFLGTLVGLFFASLGYSEPGTQISETPTLRVIRPKQAFDGLPRKEEFFHREEALMRRFASDHGFSIKWIDVESGGQVAALLRNDGDVAISCSSKNANRVGSIRCTSLVFDPSKKRPTSTLVALEHKTPDVVWAVVWSEKFFLDRLESFLLREHPGVFPPVRMGDLASIKARGYIRVLTRNNPACYFIHRGELMGFEYELIKRYARHIGVEVVVVIPPRWVEMKDWLAQGHADVVAACVTISEHRKKLTGLEFCHPYENVKETIVTRASDKALHSANDLKGRTVYLRKTSHYFRTIQDFKKKSGIDFAIKLVPDSMETREILHRVESGEFDLTVADSGFLDIEINAGHALRAALVFSDTFHYGWGVRINNPNLKESIDRFFVKQLASSSYQRLHQKYFLKKGTIQDFVDSKPLLTKPIISPYDELIKAAAQKYNFHWCLIAAVMYRESHFKPYAKSWSGAQGLMQLMPRTARELGLNKRTVLIPEKNINAGVKYLWKQRRRVPAQVIPLDRLCFALASYNGGYGHLIDARKLAKRLGRNPDVWVENVDYTYSLLSTPKYAKQARYGYCRSKEIIDYVHKIMVRYVAYKTEIERLSQTKDELTTEK